MALAMAAILALSIQIAAAEPAAKEKPQGLWVANENYISGFQGSALERGGEPRPRLSFRIKDYLNPLSMTFDRHNNLWVTSLATDDGFFPILEISPADIASLKSGKPVKRRVVFPERGAVGVPIAPWTSLAFDAAGNLWVSSFATQSGIMEFSPSQIKKSAPSRSILIAFPFPGPIRFDSSDNLWVSAGSVQLWKFAPSDRAASGAPNPGLKVTLPDGFGGVQDFAFDSSGNLWLAGAVFPVTGTVDQIDMISAGDLVGTGEISPPASLTITSSAFGTESSGSPGGICLGGIDFDHSGDLWVSTHCDPDTHLIEFTPDQLSIGGILTPSATIGQNSTKTNLALPGPIRFGPAIK